ncbi:MAG: chorismate synthase [Chlamydiae bacterium]|nr:chorismate synthase [Chlamydiota bacterium]
MGSNSFGKSLVLTTAGESHGKGYVAILDGVPSGYEISIEKIQHDLALRAPGRSLYSSLRKESDQVDFISGLYQGKTTGAPLSFFIPNLDHRPDDYTFTRTVFRPGHADYTYKGKYGHVDLNGGGRASARETVCRVVAGSIAKQVLKTENIDVLAYVRQIHDMRANLLTLSIKDARQIVLDDPLGSADSQMSKSWQSLIQKAIDEKDSLSGSVCFVIDPMIPFLGRPVYEKLTNTISNALMTIPAVKGVIFGELDSIQTKKGSAFNDPMFISQEGIGFCKNDAAGLLGGISTHQPIYGEVFFKPPSSIAKEQNTMDRTISFEGRHDPVVVHRARIVVESMLWLVLLDELLLEFGSKYFFERQLCHTQ